MNPLRRSLTALFVTLMAATRLGAQGGGPASSRGGAGTPRAADGERVSERVSASREMSARAMRVSRPPLIDGRDTDDAWLLAPVLRDFRQFDPGEDMDPAFRTEARVVYDDRYL